MAKHVSKNLRCSNFRDNISCVLCKGYLIDATTIVECLHSFCKSCIVIHLKQNNQCPKCNTQIHKTKPLLNIRSDPTLQDIVYKLVPGLFKDEMKRRCQYYQKCPEARTLSGEERGEFFGERIIYSDDDIIPLSIEYLPQVINYSYLPLDSSSSASVAPGLKDTSTGTTSNSVPNVLDMVETPAACKEEMSQRRYLRCPAAVRVEHLKKLIRNKYDLKYYHDVELFFKHDLLDDDYSIVDLAYIYSWRRNGPLALYYKISELRTALKRKPAASKAPKLVPKVAVVPKTSTPKVGVHKPITPAKVTYASAGTQATIPRPSKVKKPKFIKPKPVMSDSVPNVASNGFKSKNLSISPRPSPVAKVAPQPQSPHHVHKTPTTSAGHAPYAPLMTVVMESKLTKPSPPPLISLPPPTQPTFTPKLPSISGTNGQLKQVQAPPGITTPLKIPFVPLSSPNLSGQPVPGVTSSKKLHSVIEKLTQDTANKSVALNSPLMSGGHVVRTSNAHEPIPFPFSGFSFEPSSTQLKVPSRSSHLPILPTTNFLANRLAEEKNGMSISLARAKSTKVTDRSSPVGTGIPSSSPAITVKSSTFDASPSNAVKRKELDNGGLGTFKKMSTMPGQEKLLEFIAQTAKLTKDTAN